MMHYDRHLSFAQAWSAGGPRAIAAVALGKLGQRQPRATKRLMVRLLQTVSVNFLLHLASLTSEDPEHRELHALVLRALAASQFVATEGQ